MKTWIKPVLQAVLIVLAVAAGVRIAWMLLAPAVPALTSLVIVLVIFWLVLANRSQ